MPADAQAGLPAVSEALRAHELADVEISAVAARRPMRVEPAQAAEYLVHTLAGRHLALSSLFSTHPPVEARIARLGQQG